MDSGGWREKTLQCSTLVVMLVHLVTSNCRPAATVYPITTIPVNASRFTLYQMPTPFSGPCDLETGSDGHIYVSDLLTNKIAEINPQTGEVKDYDIPWTLPLLQENPLNEIIEHLSMNRFNFACVVRMGSDGYLYAANGLRNQLCQFNIKTKAIKVLTPPGLGPLGNLEPFNDMWTGPEGMYLTQTTGNVLTYYEYATGMFTNYPIPTPLSLPVGVFYGSDKYVYIGLFLSNKLARFNPRTQKITEYAISSPEFPLVVRAETEERYVWYTGFIGNSLVRYDMLTEEICAIKYPVPAGSPGENTVDENGNVWISTVFQSTIAFFSPKSKTWTRIFLPDTIVGVPLDFDIGVHYDNGTNAIWYARALRNQVGMYKLDGTEGKFQSHSAGVSYRT